MRRIATIFGVVMLLIGVMGFIPWLTPEEKLLGIFYAGAAHNIFYMITGLGGIWAGSLSDHASKSYFRIFGAIFLGLAIVGFLQTEGYIFGVFGQEAADTSMHFLIAMAALTAGFALRGQPYPSAPTSP